MPRRYKKEAAIPNILIPGGAVADGLLVVAIGLFGLYLY